MNKVILHGRLARDVDLRTTASGKSVAQVNIAVNRRGKDQGDRKSTRLNSSHL